MKQKAKNENEQTILKIIFFKPGLFVSVCRSLYGWAWSLAFGHTLPRPGSRVSDPGRLDQKRRIWGQQSFLQVKVLYYGRALNTCILSIIFCPGFMKVLCFYLRQKNSVVIEEACKSRKLEPF